MWNGVTSLALRSRSLLLSADSHPMSTQGDNFFCKHSKSFVLILAWGRV